MTNTMRCPECGSDDVICVRKPAHDHRCHACGHSMLDPLSAVAKWVVETFEIPGSMTLPAPPRRLREAIYRFVHTDRDGSLHGKALTYAEVVDWVDDECGWEPVA